MPAASRPAKAPAAVGFDGAPRRNIYRRNRCASCSSAKIPRQRPPLAAGRQNLEKGIQDLALIDPARWLQMRLDQRPFLVCHVARITPFAHILSPVFRVPNSGTCANHAHAHRHGQMESHVIPKTQETAGRALRSNTEFGGGRGIRTPGRLAPTLVFKTRAINHSAIPPACPLSLHGSMRTGPVPSCFGRPSQALTSFTSF